MQSKQKSELEIKKLANQIRQNIIKMLLEAKSGHSAGPLGMADIFATLYFHVLDHDPKNPGWAASGRLFFSKGQICPGLDATFGQAGYFFLNQI